MPIDVHQMPSSLATYFDYGRSIGGKLDRLVGADDAHSAPIILAGWLDRDCLRLPSPAPSGKIGVTVYGMSFSNNIATHMEQADPRLAITRYAGPGAPPNHSVACFERVRGVGLDPNRVQILGVLASSLPRLLTLGGLTTSFESPMPFTYPRYRLAGTGLAAEEPLVRGPDDLRDAVRFKAYVDQLARDDAFYDWWQMAAGPLDGSTFLRLLRRAYAQGEQGRRRSRYVSADGHRLTPEVEAVLGRLLVRFADAVRADGGWPLVLLIQDRGDAPDLLERAVGPLLAQRGIAFVSSREVAPNTEPENFISDGHFTEAADRRIAELVLSRLNEMSPL